jgi:O-antigen/teichoic acid export membrane protein
MERRGAMRRVGWGLADQALSSMTNFAVGIFVARSVSVSDFGAYALAFSAYCLALGVSRALSAEPFAVRFVITEPESLKQARAGVFGVALATGLASVALAALLSLVIPAEHRSLVLCLGIVLPGLLVQDNARQVLFTAGRGRSAFNNDLLWALLLIPAFTAVFFAGEVTAATLILAWGAAATVAGVVGCWQCRTVPSLRQVPSWLHSQRRLWPRYLVEGAAVNGSQQITYFVVGAVAGLAAVGELKLVLVLLGPVNVLVQGVGVVAVPEATRAIAVGRKRFVRVMAMFSVLVGFGAFLWGVSVSALPVSWGVAVVGQGWLAASVLVLPLFLVQVLNGIKTGCAVGLRGMCAANTSMWTRVAASLISVASSVIGAVTAGVQGAAWGLVAAAAVNAALWQVQFRCVLATHSFPANEQGSSRHPVGPVSTERNRGPR